MRTFKGEGEIVTLTAPYTRTAGQGAQVGGIFGIAVADVASAAEGAFALEGVYDIAKTSAQAWTQGEKVYWDDTNKRADNDSTVSMLIGVARAAAANPSATGEVRLNGTSPSGLEGPEATIAALTGTLTGTVDGAMVDVAATAAGTAGGSSPTAAQVDTGIAAAVATIVTGVNVQNKEMLTKINAIIAALKAYGVISSS